MIAERNPEKRIFTIPNILTAIRIVLIPFIVWLYTMEEFKLSIILLLASGATDVLDGFLARHYHMVTDLGKILDPIADKLTQGIMMIVMTRRYPAVFVPLMLMVLKEVSSGIGSLVALKKTNTVRSSKWHGKLATVLLYSMIILHLLWSVWAEVPTAVSMVSSLICTAAMLLSFVLYGIQIIGYIVSAPKAESAEKDRA